jgi:hypothetical protein
LIDTKVTGWGNLLFEHASYNTQIIASEMNVLAEPAQFHNYNQFLSIKITLQTPQNWGDQGVPKTERPFHDFHFINTCFWGIGRRSVPFRIHQKYLQKISLH